MSWQLFDRIRAFTRSAGVFQQERIFQDQSSLDRILQSGEFTDWSQQQALLDQTNLQINRLERYKDYEQMDEVGEISLALDLYADEASLVDPERKHSIIIKSASREVQRELEELFFKQLMIDNYIRPMIRYVCKYGDFPAEIIPRSDRKGIASLKFMNVYNFTRVETKFGDLVGFYYQDELMQEPVFLHPWQVMHLRLTSFENIYHPYGRAILEGGRKAFKQLRLMEDAALIYRITRAPEKRMFTIPIGNIPAKEVPEYIAAIARQFKSSRFYDPRTGTFNERFSPLIQEDDFWLPQRPDGSGPKIDVLKGAENLDQIKDIEYFKKKMVAPMKIPFKRVGIGEGAGEPDEKSLSSSDSQFAKAVQWVQRAGADALTKVAICHLAMAGYSVEQLKNFSITMSATSAIDELYRIETWGGRTSVMSDLKDLGWFPKEWIVTRFTDLSPDEIEELDELMAESGEAAGEGEGGGGGGGLGGLGGSGGDDLGAGGDMGDAAGGGGAGGAGGAEGGDDLEGLDDDPGDDAGMDIDAEGSSIEAQLKDLMGEAVAYNHKSEKRMISEMNKLKRNKSTIAESKQLARKRKIKAFVTKARAKDLLEAHNGFQHFVECNELDGLSSKDATIVESSLPTSVIMEVRNEYHMALCGKNDPQYQGNGPLTIQE